MTASLRQLHWSPVTGHAFRGSWGAEGETNNCFSPPVCGSLGRHAEDDMLKPGELDLSIAAEFDEGFPHRVLQDAARRGAAVLARGARRPRALGGDPLRRSQVRLAQPADLLVLARRYDGARHAARPPRALARDHAQHGSAAARQVPPPGAARLHAAHDQSSSRRTSASSRARSSTASRRAASASSSPRSRPELPMQVICEMMGVPEEDRREIYDLSNRLIGFDDPEYQGSLEAGIHGVDRDVHVRLASSPNAPGARRWTTSSRRW